MKTSFRITADGVYHLQLKVKPEPGTTEVHPAPLFLYKNRVRLVATESLPSASWVGALKNGDLIEGDASVDVDLVVEQKAEGGPIRKD